MGTDFLDSGTRRGLSCTHISRATLSSNKFIAATQPAWTDRRTPWTRVVQDLPGGAKRIDQRAEGITATIVNGRILTRDGKVTDERPGRLLRAPWRATQ